ncbi:MAG: hypothetical protein ABIN20_03325 [candidate division WOR-3 bacterium]
MDKKIISFIVFAFISNLFSAPQDSEKKEKFKLNIKFIGGFSKDLYATHNQSVGFWGFVDPNIDREYFDGYFFGMSLGIRPLKKIGLFLDIAILRSGLLMGKKGSYFEGIAVWDADPNHEDNISPTLPNDIYYISKATMGRIGAKFIYPVTEVVEPYLGIALGLVPYEIAFGNKDGSRAYSQILSDIALTYALILGTDFNLKSDHKNIMTLGIFFEIGGTATEPGTVMEDWIWQGWTYHAQFPVVPAYRFGVNLGF